MMKPVFGGSLWFWWGKFFHCKKQCSETGTELVLLHPLPPPLIYELLIDTLRENSWKQRSYESVWANIKEECCDILESAAQGSDFKRERISAVFWLSECPLFPLWHHCKQCPWQKRNTDRSFKWLPSSSSWEPSWASWLRLELLPQWRQGRRIESCFSCQLGYGDVLWQN